MDSTLWKCGATSAIFLLACSNFSPQPTRSTSLQADISSFSNDECPTMSKKCILSANWRSWKCGATLAIFLLVCRHFPPQPTRSTSLQADISSFSNDECAVTQAPQTDGFGSQFQNIIATAVYANTMNERFCLTPIVRMEHNYDSRPTFLREVNELINFPTSSPRELLKASTYEYKKRWLDDFIKVSDREHPSTIGSVRKQFLSNRDDRPTGTGHVAVHVRRSNPHDNRNTT